MHTYPLHLLLADDDEDDRMLFHEALRESPVELKLVTVKDGVQLMELLLDKETTLPHMLFLDLNMPRKTGIECLIEIKQHETLKRLPVIIYSTSFIPNVVNEVYEHGAHHYIRKPGEFSKLKRAIHQAISVTPQSNLVQPARENFVIQD
ncbi:MAG: rcp1 2 [Bacteroidetes bacterium]|nr:rcp1 2 [Bacteroidota bacterium]